MNRLGRERSPYLLQHAGNPVEWFPWGDEAFGLARRQDRLVLVSVGYSTCHWCHVMAEDCFEDPEVAGVMNRHLVCVKVDREERPDVDREYMEVCRKVNGRGGWPLNVFLTPSARPFYATTFIPGRGGDGAMGMLELVPRLSRLWIEDRPMIEKLADSLMSASPQTKTDPLPDDAKRSPHRLVMEAHEHLKRHFDQENGGFYGQPKFPMPHLLRFLLASVPLSERRDLVPLVERTLEKIWAGGIHDRVGGGFHRYSVDPHWRLPHFEKMLYDQAMLALAFLESWQITGSSYMVGACRQALEYVIRDLRSPEGGFFSAEDADSSEGEGVFYTWTWEELQKRLSSSELSLVRSRWGVRPGGNYIPEAGQPGGRNLLLHEGKIEYTPEEEALRETLLSIRQERERPFRDTKILTDWNGLMIAALARCGACLDEPRYIEVAREAADFMLGAASRPDGGLWHCYAAGNGAVEGFLDDSAFLIWGLLELYQATLDSRWEEAALDLARDCLNRFGRDGSGALAFSEGRDPRLFMNEPAGEDGPYPSGNGVMARNLLLLGTLRDDSGLFVRSGAIIGDFARLLIGAPWGALSLLDAWQLSDAGIVRVELSGVDEQGRHPFLADLRRQFAPWRFLVRIGEGNGIRPSDSVPAGRASVKGKAFPFTSDVRLFNQWLACLEERR